MLTDREKFLSKSLVIGVTVDEIMSEFNAFDWIEIKDLPIEEVIADFKKRTKFKEKKSEIRHEAFLHKFKNAILNLSALIEEVHASYNIPSSKGINNEHINRYYYIKYWADKKNIAVDYNETNFNKRKLFNFYTILFDIFADKLANFNAYNAQKEKK